MVSAVATIRAITPTAISRPLKPSNMDSPPKGQHLASAGRSRQSLMAAAYVPASPSDRRPHRRLVFREASCAQSHSSTLSPGDLVMAVAVAGLAGLLLVDHDLGINRTRTRP